MSGRLHRYLVPALFAACVLPMAAYAVEPEGTVSGTGMGIIEKPADTLRMQVPLEVEGPTLKDAMDKLKARRAEIKAALVRLGAEEKSIDVGDASTADGALDRRAALERAMRDRMGGPGAAPATAGARKVTVRCIIKADWPLKADSPEALMVQADDIQGKVKAAKVTDAPKSPAAAEAAEEAAMLAASETGRSPNDPVFYYIARINDAEYNKAMADAFAKAKDSAGKLARAAGQELGALRTLAGESNADSEASITQDDSSPYSGYAYRQQALQQRYGGTDSKEAYSSQPGKATMQVMVQASFSLKPG